MCVFGKSFCLQAEAVKRRMYRCVLAHLEIPNDEIRDKQKEKKKRDTRKEGEMLGYIVGLIAGIAQPMQTSVNSSLRMRLKSPFLASVSSFGTAFLMLAIIVLLLDHNLSIPFAEISKEPLWIWMGGLLGDVIVILCILCLPKLGSAETVILTVLGQICSGLAIDHFGLFDSAVFRMNTSRTIGALLLVAGVAIVSFNFNFGKNKNDGTSNIEAQSKPAVNGLSKNGYRLAAIIVGVAASTQIAINGRLGAVMEHSLKAAMVSMCVGFAGVTLITLALFLIKGRKGIIDDSMPDVTGKWWNWTGGVFAIVIVGGSILVAQLLGAGLATVLSVVGQVVGGVVIDATGFLGIERKSVTLKKVVGIIMMLAGVVLIQMV